VLNINREVDQAFSDLKESCGGVRNDYFGLVYMEREMGLERDRAVAQVAFGGNDYGVDGFHFDSAKRILYLFQFKYSDNHALFRESYARLIKDGVERIFGARTQDQRQNQLLLQLKSCLMENEALIDRIFVQFVFTGDPGEADKSQVLDKYREDLENKKYLIDKRFGREVTLLIEYRSIRTRVVGGTTRFDRVHSFSVPLKDTLISTDESGATMTIAFVPLVNLNEMYRDMGQRFFERNIRAALSENQAVNRCIQQSLKRIVLDKSEDPSVFAFNHNGVTLYAQALVAAGAHYKLTEPRLLNGAQTVTTFRRFLKNYEGNGLLVERQTELSSIQVLCRIITEAHPAFVTEVTINNNRQNPVDPWNLHANDMIQLELQDKFREDLQIYYERQERAFENLSDEEIEEQGYTHHKALELVRLTRTFLASDGEIDKLSRFREVFEDDRIYAQVFDRGRLRADSRKVVLCYKVQFRLGKLARDIAGLGVNKYAYVQRARNLLWALLCQAILNDPRIEAQAEEFGRGLGLEAQYTQWLSSLATTRCRFILSELVKDSQYLVKAGEGNYSFMKTKSAYKRCMEIAYKKWGWVDKRLK